jgi:hypothetical protein
MRLVLALVMLFHGVAHLPGFAIPWRLATPGEMPYHTTVAAGHVDLGDAGIRALGVVWLMASLAFVLAAAGAFAEREWWQPFAAGVCVSSLLLTSVAWPEARIGVAVNVGVLAALFVGQRFALI